MKDSKQSAFPIPCEQAIGTGLTKREYIAGMAMQGILSSADTELYYETIAKLAIKQADELLEQLKNGPQMK